MTNMRYENRRQIQPGFILPLAMFMAEEGFPVKTNQQGLQVAARCIGDACKPEPKGLVSISGITGNAKPIDGQSTDFVAEKLSHLSQEESFQLQITNTS